MSFPGKDHQVIAFRSGPFNIRLNSNHSGFIDLFKSLYQTCPLIDSSPATSYFHYQIHLLQVPGLRRLIRPQLEFLVDGIRPFEPYPDKHYQPLFEWGLNWVIAMTAHQYLLLHSAVLEYENTGVIFPALPGSGKSTLCAALSFNGWRLLSDEFGIIDYESGKLLTMSRAIGLKNESIPIIKERFPEATVGPSFHNTRKGTVAHVAPPQDSLQFQDIPSVPRLIIFPLYTHKKICQLKPIGKSLAFTKLANNSFNYKISQRRGFQALTNIIRQCDAYTLEYHSLDEATATLKQLIHEKYI